MNTHKDYIYILMYEYILVLCHYGSEIINNVFFATLGLNQLDSLDV